VQEGVDLADLDDGLDTVVTEDEASGVSKEAILRQEGPLQIRTLKVCVPSVDHLTHRTPFPRTLCDPLLS
jgi:hypothetical protein